MALKLGKFKVNAAALVLAAAAIILDAALLVSILVSAAVHEAGHALALFIFNARISEFRIEPWGFEMTVAGTLSYGREIVTAAAGLVASLVFAVLLSAAGRLLVLPGLFLPAGVSFVFCIFNALPVFPLDGGRILFNALALGFGPFGAERAVCITSCSVIFILLVTGAAIYAKTQINFTLLLAAAWLLLTYCKRNGVSIILRKKASDVSYE